MSVFTEPRRLRLLRDLFRRFPLSANSPAHPRFAAGRSAKGRGPGFVSRRRYRPIRVRYFHIERPINKQYKGRVLFFFSFGRASLKVRSGFRGGGRRKKLILPNNYCPPRPAVGKSSLSVGGSCTKQPVDMAYAPVGLS